MSYKIISSLITIAFFILVDLYVYQAFKEVVKNSSEKVKKTVFWLHWSLSGLAIGAIFLYRFGIPELVPGSWRSVILVGLFLDYISKTFGVLVLLIDDIIRGGKWISRRFRGNQKAITETPEGKGISRSEFLTKTAVIGTILPVATLSFGILSGAHDYRIRRRTVRLKNLPHSFDGIKIAQISDIHSGSFFDKKSVKGGVDLLMGEKPDLVFFTGDLVNRETAEVNDYVPVFEKIKAPLGVYSTMGNHDYGDYRSWPSEKARQQNILDLHEAHRLMGWDILLNEHRIIKEGNDQLAIIGVENWGAGRFSKYGNLEKAYKGTEEAPTKLLLSHDPSHWDAQIRPQYGDIDMTFAGHTHGFQFGVEIGNFRWSPSQYIYKQWADLYREGEQYLYVNRGFGYIGYPGRVGILPEITIIELKKA
ncbi:MAG TPA: metallophosphatase [Cytophagales bacterium]|jgi:predicted MPP superfamily phosphohydrolase|nr:metallophosphatase [Cytophagales bacterium]